jgi:hypothetical protein
LKDLPEAIKAHPARAGAAKPTGVWKFRNLNFGFRNFRRERMGNCGLGFRKQTTLVRVRKSAIRNPNSEILSTWLGYRKQEQYREVIFLLIRCLVNLSFFHKPSKTTANTRFSISDRWLPVVAGRSRVASIHRGGRAFQCAGRDGTGDICLRALAHRRLMPRVVHLDPNLRCIFSCLIEPGRKPALCIR